MKYFKAPTIPIDETALEMRSQADQETAALQQPDALPVVGKESGETDLFASATRLPSDSIAARNILKSSAYCASGQVVIGAYPGRLIQLDSELEYKVALLLSVQPDLVDLREQVRFNWHDQDGKPHKHFFDFVTTCKTGQRTGVMVKEAKRLRSERLQREIRMIGAQAVAGFVIASLLSPNVTSILSIFTTRNCCMRSDILILKRIEQRRRRRLEWLAPRPSPTLSQ